jgi:calcineurin-like phosphoesterase family protein
MSRSSRSLLAVGGLVAVLGSSGCWWWTPLRGPNFGPLGAFFHKEGLPEVPHRTDRPVYRVILVGDGGAPQPDDPTLALLRKWGDDLAGRTEVVFLGDNVYPAGVQPSNPQAQQILLQQMRATRARKVFVPGNHDWGYSGRQWLVPGVLAKEETFVESHADLAADFLPKNGCPGPTEVELLPPGSGLDGGLTLVALDLHWWLLDKKERPACEGIADTSAFLDRFGKVLEAHKDGNVLVVAHHPIRSGGPHGGQSRGFWLDLGVTLAHPFFKAPDLFEPSYQTMVRLLEKEMAADPPLAMVGGHDHSLQLIDGGRFARLVIVSGAASRLTGVTSIDGMLFAHAHLGFVVMDFYRLGTEETCLVHVVETGRGDEPVFTVALDLSKKTTAPVPLPTPPSLSLERRSGID